MVVTEELNKLFVYGIFLGEGMREQYGMSNANYAVVPGYVTVSVGGSIVEAVPVDNEGVMLTGLLVDVAPKSFGYTGIERDTWEALDGLEAGYDRIKVKTSGGQEAWMYARRGTDAKVI